MPDDAGFVARQRLAEKRCTKTAAPSILPRLQSDALSAAQGTVAAVFRRRHACLAFSRASRVSRIRASPPAHCCPDRGGCRTMGSCCRNLRSPRAARSPQQALPAPPSRNRGANRGVGVSLRKESRAGPPFFYRA